MEELYLPEALGIDTEVHAWKKFHFANSLLRLNYENIGVEVEAPVSDIKEIIYENSYPLLKPDQIIQFYTQFKCFSKTIRKHVSMTSNRPRDCLRRDWDGNAEEQKEEQKKEQKPDSRCSDCFFYDKCEIRQIPLTPQVNTPLTLDETYRRIHLIVHPLQEPIPPSIYGENMFYVNGNGPDVKKRQKGYKLIQMLQSLTYLAIPQVLRFLGIPESDPEVRKNLKVLGYDIRQPDHNRYPFCQVLGWYKRYSKGEFAFEALDLEAVESRRAFDQLSHAMDSYGLDRTKGKRIRQIRRAKLGGNGNHELFTPLYNEYINWQGTTDEFEEKFGVEWSAMYGYFKSQGYKTRGYGNWNRQIIARRKYTTLHNKYLNWDGCKREFEKTHEVKWKVIHNWFKNNGFEYRRAIK